MTENNAFVVEQEKGMVILICTFKITVPDKFRKSYYLLII